MRFEAELVNRIVLLCQY